MKRFSYFAIFFLAQFSLGAQQNIDYRNLGLEQGALAFSRSIADVQGYIWCTSIVRTDKRIFRFDGKEFITFNDSIGSVYTSFRYCTWRRYNDPEPIKLDPAGFVWCGTDNGIWQMMDGKPIHKFTRKNGLLSDTILDLRFDRLGDLWVVQPNGIVYISSPSNNPKIEIVPKAYCKEIVLDPNASTSSFKRSKKIAFIEEDSSGVIWWGYSLDSVSFFCHVIRGPNKEVSYQSFSLKETFSYEMPLKNGFLLRSRSRLFYSITFPGTPVYLDAQYDELVGHDKMGNYYFLGKQGPDKKRTITRDKVERWSDFGKSPNAFIYPERVDCGRFGNEVGNEIWINNVSADKEPIVIVGDSIKKLIDLYPNIDLQGAIVYEIGPGTFWASKFQKKSCILFRVNSNAELIALPPNSNGSNILGLDAFDSSYVVTIDVASGKPGTLFYKYKQGDWKFLNRTLDQYGVDNCGKLSWTRDTTDSKWTVRSYRGGEIENAYLVKDVIKIVVDSLDGCYALLGKHEIAYLKKGQIKNFNCPGIDISDIIQTYARGIYVISNDLKIYFWNPEKEIAPSPVPGIPKNLSKVENFGSTVFFTNGTQLGWMENGKPYLLDTLKFPGYGFPTFHARDQAGRTIIAGKNGKQLIEEFLLIENGSCRAVSIKPVENDFFYFAISQKPTKELIYNGGTEIFRYDSTLHQFYKMADIGQNFGYIWTMFIDGDTLLVTGWSTKIMKFFLPGIHPEFPVLSFGGMTIDGNAVPVHEVSIDYGNNLSVHYIAIEKFGKKLINYQTRIIGIDSAWSAATRNESREFDFLPPGKYRFEVRAMGKSGLWGTAIGFDFTILTPWYKSMLAYCAYVLLFILFVWMIILLNSRRLKSANLKLQHKIDDATSEIVEQKNIIEEKNKDIVSSIEYAKRIQSALLASKTLLDKNLGEYFIYYQPKDIVSGDFYWASDVGNKFLLLAGDCTGHGVPGAFMSLLNISILNETTNVRGVSSTDEILNLQRESIMHALNPEGAGAVSRDGMDCVLCAFDLEKKELDFSGANNSVWIARRGEMLELKGEKQPIGTHEGKSILFSKKEFDLNKNDVVYMFSDGFADQFGGEKGKKFKYSRLREKLLEISNEELEQQKKILEKTFNNWKGNLEQVDDVLVIGVKIK